MSKSLSFHTAGEIPQVVPQELVQVLSIGPFDGDQRHLAEILRQANWRQHHVRTLAEALAFLKENPAPVAICEAELPDGTWKDVLAELGRMEYPPMLIVTSRLADEILWSEVLHLGGYNVLAQPIDKKEVVHVVGLAAHHWKNQWERLALAQSA